MWEVSVAVPLSARHRVRDEHGRGGLEHSHRWRIRAAVRAATLDPTGWVLDFHVLAYLLRELVAPYEGAYVNDVAPFDDVNPTRENIARVFADGLAAKIDDARAHVHRVEIWEGDECGATYYRPAPPLVPARP